MAEILPIRRETLYNQLINHKLIILYESQFKRDAFEDEMDKEIENLNRIDAKMSKILKF